MVLVLGYDVGAGKERLRSLAMTSEGRGPEVSTKYFVLVVHCQGSVLIPCTFLGSEAREHVQEFGAFQGRFSDSGTPYLYL